MHFDLGSINWLAVGASVVAGQLISTLWFIALFGEAWAHEYGARSRQEHTAAIPGYTYAVQIICTATQALALAVLVGWLGASSIGEALALAAFVAIGFCVTNGLPGQAFLKRWRVAAIAYGCQSTMIVAMTLILSLWK